MIGTIKTGGTITAIFAILIGGGGSLAKNDDIDYEIAQLQNTLSQEIPKIVPNPVIARCVVDDIISKHSTELRIKSLLPWENEIGDSKAFSDEQLAHATRKCARKANNMTVQLR